MRKIQKLQPNKVQLPSKKRVAAYARISVERGRTLDSLSAQVSYYSDYIQKQPGWEYIGVYADSGETGTSARRDEFQRLIADCEAGKIDIVLTKSISRFARNTVDLLQTVRRLTEIGVEVRFEREGINSITADGELMLTILASFAQEESRNMSENIKWTIRRGFQKGKQSSTQLYGYRWDGENFVLQQDEAEIVRYIFTEYLAGKSSRAIAKSLNEMDVKSLYGCNFHESSILSILENEKYIGMVIMQKTFVEDPISRVKKINNGELPRHVIENAHPAIIDQETFDKVQSRLQSRKVAVERTAFTGKIRCKFCGVNFQRCTKHYKNKNNIKITTKAMQCANKKHGKPCECDTKEIPENILETATAEILGLAEFDANIFIERIKQIVVPSKHTLVYHFNNGKTVTREWKSTASKDCWTPERKAAQSKRAKALVVTDELREARKKATKAHYAAHPERRKADSERAKKYRADNPDWCKRQGEKLTAHKSEWWTPERRAAQSERRKAYFAKLKATKGDD